MLNKKKLTIYLVFCLSLVAGLILGENPSGGGRIDHSYLLPFIENFSLDFKSGFKLFLNQPLSLVHSPSFYLIAGFFKNYTEFTNR